MTFELPVGLIANALEPYISKETLDYYGKHHQTYVDTLNKFTEGHRRQINRSKKLFDFPVAGYLIMPHKHGIIVFIELSIASWRWRTFRSITDLILSNLDRLIHLKTFSDTAIKTFGSG